MCGSAGAAASSSITSLGRDERERDERERDERERRDEIDREVDYL